MSPLTRWLLIGAGGWALFTVLFRFIGHYLFPVDIVVLTVVFLVMPVVLYFATRPVLRLIGARPDQFPLAAAAIVVPGMILDAIVVANLRIVLPNIDRSLDGTMGSFLLLAYASILVASIVDRDGAVWGR